MAFIEAYLPQTPKDTLTNQNLTYFLPKVTFKKQKPYLQRVNQGDQGPEQKAKTQLSDQNDST